MILDRHIKRKERIGIRFVPLDNRLIGRAVGIKFVPPYLGSFKLVAADKFVKSEKRIRIDPVPVGRIVGVNTESSIIPDPSDSEQGLN